MGATHTLENRGTDTLAGIRKITGFPAQDFKMRLGGDALIADTLAPAGEIVHLDEDKFEISLKRGKNRGPLPHRFSLIPKGPLGDEVLRAAIARYIGAVLESDEDQYAAITGILRRDYPRFQGLADIGNYPDEVALAIGAIGRLDRSHLLIQGPPGAGKTYTASHAITEMLARGKRVGVSSHSHKAINKLLDDVEKAATDRGLRFGGIKKSSYEEQFLHGSIIEDTTDNGEAAEGGHDLIAGTALLFAREEFDQQLDYLFVDEAGQVSLGFFPYLITTFSWHRFSAISLWLLVLFLIYVTATEFSQLFGPGELRRLFFTHRPSELQLNRRQRFRELLRLSRLTDAHSVDEFRDPTNPAHRQLIDILQGLAPQSPSR